MRRIDSIIIRGDRRNTRRDPQAGAAYEAAVEDLLQRIFCTHVGAIVRRYLRSGFRIYLYPEIPTLDGSHPGTRAIRERGSIPRGHPIREPARHARAGQLVRRSEGGGRGTGWGSSAVIRVDIDRLPRPTINSTADVVLLHELVHALRSQHGTIDRTPCGFGFQTFEEFAAITVENMYRSELRRVRRSDRATSPRGTFAREDLMWPTEWGSHPRIELERASIARFRDQMPGFTAALALLPDKVCPHAENPFVEYHYRTTSTRLPTRILPPSPTATGWFPRNCTVPSLDDALDSLDDFDPDDLEGIGDNTGFG